MKKVININFQGRVVPIEETAYDMLNRYVDSLRSFFANEEGRDEIINDIEGRIAELFGEVLKKGSTCIVDQDVETIIASMGRPEDFAAEEDNVKSRLDGESFAGSSASSAYGATSTRKLYRDETNKKLGGVCAGIANYFNMDITVVRIIFLLFFFFGGVGLITYFILWIAVPGSSSVKIGSTRKRLFRDPENKIIAGVCSGLAQYFAVQVWVPRVLFLIPFFSFVFRWGHWGWFDFPHFLSFSFSPGSAVIYIIFWLVLPEAKSAADKLEMKGERVDLNNIKSTIQGDLEGFKERAQGFGKEMQDRAREFGNNFSAYSQKFNQAANATDPSAAVAEPAFVPKRSRGTIGRIIVVLLKAFVYFVLGCILFAIVVGLFAAGVALTGLLPAYSFVLNDGYQKLLAYGTAIFFVWVPVIGIVTWLIRRITGKRSNSGAVRIAFLSLWILGLICFINLIVQLRGEFKYRNYPQEQSVALANPAVNKLEVKYASSGSYYNDNWFKIEPFGGVVDADTLFVKNIRVRVIKSNNDSFQVTVVKIANSSSKANADNLATRINYNVRQVDSLLLLDKGVPITRNEKFRNQQVIVTVAVPVGKRILIHDNVGWGNDVRVDFGHGDDYWDWENNNETERMDWRGGVEYVMTSNGLKRVGGAIDNDEDNENRDEESSIDEFKKSRDQLQREKEQRLRELERIDRELQTPDTTGRYHYRGPNAPAPATPAAPEERKTKAVTRTTAADVPNGINDTAIMKYSL